MGPLRGSLPTRVDGPGRPELRQGAAGRDAVLPLGLPDGGVRELRDDGERRARSHVRDLPAGPAERPRPRGAPRSLPRDPRSRGGCHGLRREARAGEAVDHPEARETTVGRGTHPDPGGAGGVQAVQHVHQLRSVLRRLPDLPPGAGVRGPRRHRPGAAVQPGQPRPGRPGARRGPIVPGRGLVLHVRGRMLGRLPEARGSRGSDPAVQGHEHDRVVQVGPPAVGEAVNARHTTFHPKWHRERMPIFWWLRKWNYTKFITRELTSLAVAYTALLLVVEIACAARGEGPWSRLEAWLRSPAVLVFHGIVLLFLLVHSVTW